MRPVRLLILVALTALAFACGDDDNGNGDTPDASASACLPADTIACTVGEDAPCVAECSDAFCRNFMHTGGVCTSPCAGVDDCPDGWSCNNMGFCRPPG